LKCGAAPPSTRDGSRRPVKPGVREKQPYNNSFKTAQ
jgi:hypothetical protein